MNIFINQEKKIVEDNINIDLLLKTLSFQDKYIAIEVNLEIIPKSEYSKYILKENDKIEIIRAVGGG
ncbi:MAG: thiamine biosynthesis protein ThiS [Gammaproteobacteria bacterium]|nr:thiamine biosynthesis protein ThiS [Gammaproteobacteria bacterium]|tara:strand:- start:3507 stop:3707 length:201 start_codon:yes stop_codon:yes gene_type:complete